MTTVQSVQSVQSWLAQVQTTMDNLPSALAAAAPRGNFAAVLSSAQALFAGGVGGVAGATTAAPASSAGAPASAAAPNGTTTLLPSSSPAGPSPAGAAGQAGTGQAVVAEAQHFLGVPYLWGGTSPSGFDCSGLVQYVYGRLGVDLPRTSQEQALVGTPVPSLAQAQPGDLVFYAGSDGTAASPGHVGIYLGNGQMIDAPYTGASVRVDPVGTPVAIRRVLSQPAVSQPGVSQPGTAPAGAPLSSAAGPASPPAELAPQFLAAAARYQVPVRLLTAVAKVESNFTPTAVSSAGAQGLMQLMPATAASLGVDPLVTSQAIDGAARLLSGYLRQFGSIPQALAAYNAGAAAVQRYGGVPPYPQTQAYVQAVEQAMGTTTAGSAA